MSTTKENSLFFKDLIQGSIKFILDRKKETGGFGATPKLPATVEDTYFALAGLKLCEKLKGDLETLNFLLKQDFQRFMPEIKIKWLKSLFWLGGTPPQNFKDQLKNSLKYPPQRLSAFSALVEMGKVLRVELEELSNLKNYARSLTFHTLKDLYYLSEILGNEICTPKVLKFIIKAQNPDGGFGFFPGTTSYLENTYFACRLMKRFGLFPKDLEGLKFFVLSLYRRDGGFARAPGGISFLETTYYALWILLRFFK